MPSGAKNYSNTALKRGDIYNEAIKSGARGLPYLKVSNNGNKLLHILNTYILLKKIMDHNWYRLIYYLRGP